MSTQSPQLLIATKPILVTVPAELTCSHQFRTIHRVSKMLYLSSCLDSFFTDFSMYTFYSQSEGHGNRVEQKRPDHLTLHDLQIPDVPPSHSGCVCQERTLSGTAERRAVAGGVSPPSSNSMVSGKIVCVFLRERFKPKPDRNAVHHLVSCNGLLFVHV